MKKIGIDVSILAAETKTGIGIYCFNLVDQLLQINKTDKFILFAITPINSSNQDINYFKKYSNVEIKIIKLPIQVFRRLFLLWQKLEWPKIEKLIGKVDIFHSFNWYFPPQNKGKSVATFYDLSSILYPDWHKSETSQIDEIRFKRMSKKADLVITISQNSKKDFLSEYQTGEIEVIYPASNLESNIEQEIKGIGEYVLFVGTLEPRKNIVNLIKGFLASKIKTKLVLVGGEGWNNKEIWDLVKANKDQIIVTGFVNDLELRNFYRKALCLLYPSFYEGFGIPVLEALTLGIPVITSKISSLKEVGGEAVLYVDPAKPEEIAKALQRIYKDKNLRMSLVRNGLKQASRFSWKKSAKKLNDLYQDLSK